MFQTKLPRIEELHSPLVCLCKTLKPKHLQVPGRPWFCPAASGSPRWHCGGSCGCWCAAPRRPSPRPRPPYPSPPAEGKTARSHPILCLWLTLPPASGLRAPRDIRGFHSDKSEDVNIQYFWNQKKKCVKVWNSPTANGLAQNFCSLLNPSSTRLRGDDAGMRCLKARLHPLKKKKNLPGYKWHVCVCVCIIGVHIYIWHDVRNHW